MDNMRFMRLWDWYRNLLTSTQREITDLYFNLDLTVSEIAEQKGISRQAVSDCLAGCKKQLQAYEDKLGFEKTITQICLEQSFLLTDINRWSERFFAEHPDLKEGQEELTSILNRDYEGEATQALDKSGT
ncbi:MAG: hypothetical protein LUD27_08705 [Clostridia bacterium]|nr:hypothetical protein [Clostridia bacterium]